MGARSYIVRGKGSARASSCAHGAGRLMSRNAAHRKFNLEDLKQQTSGVICRKDKSVIDEIPGAYKPIDEVMANQSDLVEVVHTLKQVVCVKGDEDRVMKVAVMGAGAVGCYYGGMLARGSRVTLIGRPQHV